jgi:hypothetical protein
MIREFNSLTIGAGLTQGSVNTICKVCISVLPKSCDIFATLVGKALGISLI